MTHLVTIRPVKTLQNMGGVAVALALGLLSAPCHAQTSPSSGQCEQVRAAIAQYGLDAARKHAMEHHGLTRVDLRTIEQSCGIGDRDRDRERVRRIRR